MGARRGGNAAAAAARRATSERSHRSHRARRSRTLASLADALRDASASWQVSTLAAGCSAHPVRRAAGRFSAALRPQGIKNLTLCCHTQSLASHDNPKLRLSAKWPVKNRSAGRHPRKGRQRRESKHRKPEKCHSWPSPAWSWARWWVRASSTCRAASARRPGPFGAIIAWTIAGTGMYMLARVFQALAETQAGHRRRRLRLCQGRLRRLHGLSLRLRLLARQLPRQRLLLGADRLDARRLLPGLRRRQHGHRHHRVADRHLDLPLHDPAAASSRRPSSTRSSRSPRSCRSSSPSSR